MKPRLFFISLPLVCSIFVFVAWAQTTPPTVILTTPPGMQRGTTTTLVIEGTDLTGASAIVFSEPGLSGKILSVNAIPKEKWAPDSKPSTGVKSYFEEPAREEATVEVSAEKWTAIGTHAFRFITPHGSSSPGRIDVAAFPETGEREPNNSRQQAQPIVLPVTINGTILKAGDFDEFGFEAKKGQEIVFLVNAAGIGSTLDPVIEVFDSQGRILVTNLEEKGKTAIGCRIPEDGNYRVRINDYLKSGSLRHVYRLTVGEFPFLKDRYPLGLKAGTTHAIQVSGYNLGQTRVVSPEPFGLAPGKIMDIVTLGASTSQGDSVNVLPLAIGRYDEIEETGRNNTPESAQELKVPITVNGRITRDSSGVALPDYYRFSATKGQKIILETAANRLGSPLDSVIEILDAKGNLLPRVTARAIWKSQITLFDRDSKSPGLRIAGAQTLRLDDLCGGW